jgi:hypothetical protein
LAARSRNTNALLLVNHHHHGRINDRFNDNKKGSLACSRKKWMLESSGAISAVAEDLWQQVLGKSKHESSKLRSSISKTNALLFYIITTE